MWIGAGVRPPGYEAVEPVGKTTPMRMMPEPAHSVPSLKLSTGATFAFAWKNRPGPGMFVQVRTRVSPALSSADPEETNCAPAANDELAQPKPGAPGFGMPLPPAPLHGHKAAVSPGHSAVNGVP